MTLLHPVENQLGTDITEFLPREDRVRGVIAFRSTDDLVWRRAVKHLHVRSNDGHTAFSYGLASALCELHPEADRDVVLPAIILHDTGWSRIPEDEVLQAIAPGDGRPDLVIRHEKEGAKIARHVLEELGHNQTTIAEIIEIIDGHDSRLTSLSLNDSLVKDADKLWRLTPHGIDTVMGWFGLTRSQAHLLIASRVHDHLFTDTARAMARALAAVASIDTSHQRIALDDGFR